MNHKEHTNVSNIDNGLINRQNTLILLLTLNNTGFFDAAWSDNALILYFILLPWSSIFHRKIGLKALPIN